ncbi:MAG: type II 3-dehydroquinate dehydratase [Clostridia bacterium]|nr:type II 3-dehydroquinate dehydratase [Clostridia bacterium]MBQ5792938.1 type II 3-dehydroquinate dehydratase [Clostridia bacterium]
MNFLVINGPNLNLLGRREPDIYGKRDYAALCAHIKAAAGTENIEIDIMQSNHEGVIIDAIQGALGKYDGIVINPAAYTHTSIAIADAIAAVDIPTAEVHLSDVDNREDFRRISFVTPVCVIRVTGLGFDSYSEAITGLATYIRTKS